ncbi:MAG: glycosyltransferase family 2 protein [Thermoanaerobaculia bacterium]
MTPPAPPPARWKQFSYRTIAAEISSFTRYYDRVLQLLPLRGDTGFLLDCIEAPRKTFLEGELTENLRDEKAQRTALLLNGSLNVRGDIQQLLQRLHESLSRTSRIVVVLYNPYYGPLYRTAHRLGLKGGEDPTTFLTYGDLRDIARLAGFEIVRVRPCVYSPFRLLGLGSIANRILGFLPIIRGLALVSVAVLRPIVPDREEASVSVVVPARNERDNIRPLLDRLPPLPAGSEVIFVEGHSTDGTWDAIQESLKQPKPGLAMSAYQQTGVGKNDAVRLAMSKAKSDVLLILDADLSVPPEDLKLFLDAYRAGYADFINGTRLVYPMESAAMRFLNKLGNIFFAKALTFTLNARITDALCGTKLVAVHDVRRIERWRADFGDFDPFGDFELLFPAAILGLGIVNVPIRYRARTYGQTNIRRFRDGLRLLRMVITALFRVRAGRIPHSSSS